MFASLTFTLPQMSTIAPKIDLLYDFLYWSSLVLLLITTAAMLYFAIKYREGKTQGEVPYLGGNHLFEWATSTILGGFFIAVFIWGLIGFNEIHNTPADSYEINVIGQQWKWIVQYANGKSLENKLVIPKGVPVKLILSSRDVIHSFFIPEFRVKQDAVPGLYTSMWFQATHTGEANIFCAEFCGLDHSNMLGKVEVLEPSEFKAWLNGVDPGKINIASVGKNLFEKRNCVACHSISGNDSKNGPSLKGLAGSQVTLDDGSAIAADDNYIRQSITNPGGQVVKGYAPIMPTYKGMMNEEELSAVVAYVKSLKE